MKKLYFLLFTFLIAFVSFGQTTVFINEIHYDNSGTDSGEGVEIAGPAGTDLSTYTVTPYNGNGGGQYSALTLSGTIPDEGSGYGAVWFDISGLQNGSPDGIALDNNGTLIQFLSYEGSFAATDGPANGVTSTDIGVVEPGAVGESLQLIGTGDTYEEFTWTGPVTSSPGLINTGQTFSTASIPSITITSPSDGTVFTPGTTSVNVEWSTLNTVGTETVDITVNGSTTTGVTSPYTVATADGQTYNVTVELVDGGVIDSDMVSFSVSTITSVSDIATLRAGTIGDYYMLTNEAVISYIVTENTRNQKYIQDATGGMLIDDPSGTISTVFNIGDGMTGIQGQLSQYSGVLQFVPIANVASASSTGNTITPQEISAADLLNNGEDYESELIKVLNVTFADAGGNFADNTNYNIIDATDGTTTTVCRVSFGDEDLIGAIIPSTTSSVIGLGGEFNTTYQVLPRYLSDVEGATLNSDNFTLNSLSIYPNPTSTGFVTINSNNAEVINAKVFDILGKQVLDSNVNNNQLNVSNLNAGVYILKLTQNNATTTKKLVIK